MLTYGHPQAALPDRFCYPMAKEARRLMPFRAPSFSSPGIGRSKNRIPRIVHRLLQSFQRDQWGKAKSRKLGLLPILDQLAMELKIVFPRRYPGSSLFALGREALRTISIALARR